MILHSKTDLFFPLQLLVPLWSIPRLPMQQLAFHWEFAGASSQMTLWSATSCATNQWAMRGTVMSKQVRRPGTKGSPQPSIGKTSYAKVPLHVLCTLPATKTVISVTTICFGPLPLPGLPCCQLQQDPSQEQIQDMAAAGRAGMGRGRWMKPQGFLEGGHCIRTRVLHPWQSTVFLKSKSSYHQHSHWNPQMILQLILVLIIGCNSLRCTGTQRTTEQKCPSLVTKLPLLKLFLQNLQKWKPVECQWPVEKEKQKLSKFYKMRNEKWAVKEFQLLFHLIYAALEEGIVKLPDSWSKGVEHKELSWTQHPKQCTPIPLCDIAVGKSGKLECRGTVNALLLSFQSIHWKSKKPTAPLLICCQTHSMNFGSVL